MGVHKCQSCGQDTRGHVCADEGETGPQDLTKEGDEVLGDDVD